MPKQMICQNNQCRTPMTPRADLLSGNWRCPACSWIQNMDKAEVLYDAPEHIKNRWRLERHIWQRRNFDRPEPAEVF